MRQTAWACSALLLVAALTACGNQYHHPQLSYVPDQPVYVAAKPGPAVDSLRVLITGWSRSNDAHMYAGGDPKKEVLIPLPAFLIERQGEYVLVDTALSPALATKPEDYLGKRLAAVLASQLRTLILKPGWDVPARLQALGIDRRQVKSVILTHAHFDHTGANRYFRDALFFATPGVWEAGRHGPLLEGYWNRDFPEFLKWSRVVFRRTRPFLTFKGRLDLFGDGSVVLVPLPGHDHESLGVYVRTKERPTLLIGDAAYTMRNIRETILNGYLADPRRSWDTLHRLKRLTEVAPEVQIVPSHDAEAVRGLAPPDDPALLR